MRSPGYKAVLESYRESAQALEKLITKSEKEDIRAPMKVEFAQLLKCGFSPEEAFEAVTEWFLNV